MTSIDEAIAHAREIAEEQRKDNENCKYKSQYGCKGCADYYSKPCIECAEEHEQIAEWLEELKAYRENSNGYNKEDIELNRNAMYNKALDDFANALKENYDYLPQILLQEAFDGYIDEYAEQLKEGGIK